MEKWFTVKCHNCGSDNVSVISWDRSYDRNIIEIECSDCGQTVIDDELVKEGSKQ
jgi:transcription elongation factor Elf1